MVFRKNELSDCEFCNIVGPVMLVGPVEPVKPDEPVRPVCPFSPKGQKSNDGNGLNGQRAKLAKPFQKWRLKPFPFLVAEGLRDIRNQIFSVFNTHRQPQKAVRDTHLGSFSG